MIRKAFTLIELVFVIIIVGILSAAIIPRMQSNAVAESTTKVLSHIRYTQHLAMINDKYDSTNQTWFRNKWRIEFSGNTYSIKSGDTFAVQPLNHEEIIEDIELLGLNDIVLGGTCEGETVISFDNMGRPYLGSLANTNKALVSSGSDGELLRYDPNRNCTITLTDGETTAVITMQPETGYVSASYN